MRRAVNLRRACLTAPSWPLPAPLGVQVCSAAAALATRQACPTRSSWQLEPGSRLRGFCASAAPPAPPEQTPEQSPTLYTGPLAVTLRRVKLLSLASLAVTTLGAPALVQLSSPEAVSEAAKLAMSSTIIAFGCFTTGLLSFFSSPYVLRLALAADGMCSVTTLNLLAKPVTVTLHVSELHEPQTVRPLATFAARGKLFFLDGNIANEKLLAALGLKKAEVVTPSEYDDDEEEDDDLDRRADKAAADKAAGGKAAADKAP